MGRRAIVLLVALILAGLAAWAVWNFLEGVEEERFAGQQLTTVFIAGTGIAEGTDGDILVSAYNSNSTCQDEETDRTEVNCQIKIDLDQVEDVPVGAIDSAERLQEVLSGKVAAGPISAGSILTTAQWTDVGGADVRPLSSLIPSGKQALTVSTSDVQGVNGFVEAGDRINMIITLDIAFDLIPDESPITLPGEESEEGEAVSPVEGEGEPVVVTLTRYVMQDIPVIAVGREVRPDGDAAPTVDADGRAGQGAAEGEEGPQGNSTTFTLEVTPEQAERIVYAFENGSIWLTLVPDDFVEVETNGVIIDNLFGGDLVDSVFGGQEDN